MCTHVHTQQLAPAPRASLQTALSNPHYYLPSVGHMTEASGLDQNMPDVCVVYQLHLECGRLINLYDWLQVSTRITIAQISLLLAIFPLGIYYCHNTSC